MKLRIRKMPRPLHLSRFSGARQSARVEGSKPGPSSRTRINTPPAVLFVELRELDVHALAAVVAVAMLHGVNDRLADGYTHRVKRVLVQTGPAPNVIADKLDQVEDVKAAGEIETDGRAANHRLYCRLYKCPRGTPNRPTDQPLARPLRGTGMVGLHVLARLGELTRYAGRPTSATGGFITHVGRGFTPHHPDCARAH